MSSKKFDIAFIVQPDPEKCSDKNPPEFFATWIKAKTTVIPVPQHVAALDDDEVRAQVASLRTIVKRRRALELEKIRLQAMCDLLKKQRTEVCIDIDTMDMVGEVTDVGVSLS